MPEAFLKGPHISGYERIRAWRRLGKPGQTRFLKCLAVPCRQRGHHGNRQFTVDGVRAEVCRVLAEEDQRRPNLSVQQLTRRWYASVSASHKGLPAYNTLIKRLPLWRKLLQEVRSSSTCVVCQEFILPHEEHTRLPCECPATYHLECIRKVVVQGKKECPACCRRVDEVNGIQLPMVTTAELERFVTLMEEQHENAPTCFATSHRFSAIGQYCKVRPADRGSSARKICLGGKYHLQICPSLCPSESLFQFL